MTTLVLYHAQCNDGFGAAWVAHRHHGKQAEYRAVQYGDAIPKDVDGRDVLILDFSFQRPVLLELERRAKSLRVLDHHQTAQDDLAGLEFAVFDLSKSGATLTWSHFFPGQECPWLLKYIEDRDLWKHSLPYCEEVSAALQSYRRSFSVWDSIIEKGLEALVAEGRPIARYKNRLVKAASSRYRMIELAGYRVPCVTSCVLQSEIGSRLSANFPFVAIMFELGDKRIWSLRSHMTRGINVAEIARQRGGGGHPNAASFIQRIEDVNPGEKAPQPAAEADEAEG